MQLYVIRNACTLNSIESCILYIIHSSIQYICDRLIKIHGYSIFQKKKLLFLLNLKHDHEIKSKPFDLNQMTTNVLIAGLHAIYIVIIFFHPNSNKSTHHTTHFRKLRSNATNTALIAVALQV